MEWGKNGMEWNEMERNGETEREERASLQRNEREREMLLW
jgi:hypothetical protein